MRASADAASSRHGRVLTTLAGVLGALAMVPFFVAAEEPGATRFTVTASRYAFDPARIEVRQGDRVELVLRSSDTTHGLAIEAYGVKVAIPKGGEEVSVVFMAHRAGTFRMKCSEYCGSGHRRMQGRLVVTEAGQ